MDLQFAKDRLALYYEAEAAVLSGQEYQIGGRTLKRADLAQIQQGIKTWENKVATLERPGGGLRVRRFVPLDI